MSHSFVHSMLSTEWVWSSGRCQKGRSMVKLSTFWPVPRSIVIAFICHRLCELDSFSLLLWCEFGCENLFFNRHWYSGVFEGKSTLDEEFCDFSQYQIDWSRILLIFKVSYSWRRESCNIHNFCSFFIVLSRILIESIFLPPRESSHFSVRVSSTYLDPCGHPLYRY